MEGFISAQILEESVEYMEYAAKARRRSKEELVFRPYFATGISNGFFTRLQASFSTRSFTAAELLARFPAKKSVIVVVAYECQGESSAEESDEPEEEHDRKKQHRGEVKKPRRQVTVPSRKGAYSMAHRKV